MIAIDDILTPDEVERFTGLPRSSYTAQANFLRRNGIKCLVNAKKEVIVCWSWIRLSAEGAKIDPDLPSELVEPDFSSLERKRA